ncbi:YdeI/OmpD-associated family protein [Blastococcus sp. SYSU DS0617]
MTLPTDLPVLPFPDQAALEAWLEDHHETAPGLYVKIAKKGSGVPSVNWEQMVEVLLCFGWIDGRANRLDDSFYLQRITPRRPRSVWSAKNVATVERLIAEGRMRPAGLAVVEAAKADGRWERAYAGPATITVPDDLAAALDAEPDARAAFDALDGQNRYAVLWRVQTANTEKTRAKRIAAAVELLAAGGTPHPPSGQPG